MNISNFSEKKLKDIIRELYSPSYPVSVRNTTDVTVKRLFYNMTLSEDADAIRKPNVMEFIIAMNHISDFIKSLLVSKVGNVMIYNRYNYDKNGTLYGDLEIKGYDGQIFDTSTFLDVANLCRLKKDEKPELFWRDIEYSYKHTRDKGQITGYKDCELADTPMTKYLVNVRNILAIATKNRDSLVWDYNDFNFTKDETVNAVIGTDGQLSLFDAVGFEETEDKTDKEKTPALYRRSIYVSDETMKEFAKLWKRVKNETQRDYYKEQINNAILETLKIINEKEEL